MIEGGKFWKNLYHRGINIPNEEIGYLTMKNTLGGRTFENGSR